MNLMLINLLPSVFAMDLVILAASGRTGLAITRQALQRGHTVTAIARVSVRVISQTSFMGLTTFTYTATITITITKATTDSALATSTLCWFWMYLKIIVMIVSAS